VISVKNLTLYPDKERKIAILKNLSFTVDTACRFFGIVGPSGCGKSTLLRALCSLHPFWEGEITVDGVPIPKLSSASWFKKVPKSLFQMVFQDPLASLHPRQTVHQILREPLKIQGVRFDENTLLDALQDVCLSKEHLFRYPHQLSGGERQRVSIARCLLLQPKALLLDECTSALDVTVQKEVLNLLKRIQEKRSMTCLLVSHSAQVVSYMCDGFLDLEMRDS
jgi:peptide/nickel transport system ATP-binding protein